MTKGEILGCRVQDYPNPRVPSQIRRCDRCAAEVWVSNQTLKDFERLWGTDYKVVCMMCVPLSKFVNEAERVIISDGQIREIKDYIARREA